MTNAVLEAIEKRRSVRAYTDEALSGEQIDTLVKAALQSPSAVNAQPCNVVVLKNRDIILEWEKCVIDYFIANDPALAEHNKSRNNKIFYNAPVVFIIPVKNDAKVDVGIMSQTIALAATSMGLGSIILGLPRVAFLDEAGAKWKKKLGFPEGYEYGLSVAVGYSANEGKPHEIDLSKVTVIE